MTSLQSIQSSVRESYKDMSHSRGINDIRGACGAPCVQCEKDEKILSFLDSAVSQAWEAGASAAVEYIKQEMGITPEDSRVNDYVIPYQVLEAAQSPTGEDN